MWPETAPERELRLRDTKCNVRQALAAGKRSGSLQRKPERPPSQPAFRTVLE